MNTKNSKKSLLPLAYASICLMMKHIIHLWKELRDER